MQDNPTPREPQHAHFFSHTACEYFPCHKTDSPEDFNCLYCYCPLYALGQNCGGDFTYTQSGIKDCSACLKPHKRDSFLWVYQKFPQLAALARAEHQPEE